MADAEDKKPGGHSLADHLYGRDVVHLMPRAGGSVASQQEKQAQKNNQKQAKAEAKRSGNDEHR